MWHLDIPTESELRLLATISAPAVVSIYLPTTPISQDAAADAWVLNNLEQQLLDLVDDEDFWAHQSHGLGVITTADGQWTFRLPHRPNAQFHVDDKAHLLQLIAATDVQDAHVLCLPC